MSEVKREHLAGLEMALEVMSAQNAMGGPMSAVRELIAQASAAPEQETVAWKYRERVYRTSLGMVWTDKLEAEKPDPDQLEVKDVQPLYDHAGPEEVERLREALAHIVKTVGQSRSSTRRLRWIDQRAQFALEGREYDDSLFDLPKDAGHTAERATQQARQARRELAAATQRADAAERKLGEAVGLLQRVHDADLAELHNLPYDTSKRRYDVEAFLSASAEPAECGCCGRTDRCDDDCDAAVPVQDCKPAKGGDGEVV